MVNIMECPDTEIGLGPAALSATLHPTRDFYPKELALSQAHQTGRTVQPELQCQAHFSVSDSIPRVPTAFSSKAGTRNAIEFVF